MNSTLRSQIFLADNRRLEHIEGIKSSRFSIPLKDSVEGNLQSIGALYLFKETTLGPGFLDHLIFSKDLQLLILPLVGQIMIRTKENARIIELGEATLLSVQSGEVCTLENRYENASIHYVVAAFVSSDKVEGISRFTLKPNGLLSLFEKVSLLGLTNAHIGRWQARSEESVLPQNSLSFFWVIQGAFEIENCLLEKSDGLLIKGRETIELEALANDGILLVLGFSN